MHPFRKHFHYHRGGPSTRKPEGRNRASSSLSPESPWHPWCNRLAVHVPPTPCPSDTGHVCSAQRGLEPSK